MEPVFRCPCCRGSIALWAVRPRFSCHHCQRVLISDIDAAMNRAMLTGVAAESVLLAVLWIWLGGFSAAFGVLAACGGLFGFTAGWIWLKSRLHIEPA